MNSKLQPGKYTFSYYTVVNIPVLEPRPWWKIFGRDKIRIERRSERRVYSGLSAPEAQVIADASNLHSWSLPTARVIKMLVGHDATHVQLELGEPATSYVPTSTRRGKRRMHTQRFIVRIRRDFSRAVRPEAEQLDGRTYTFRHGWLMDEGDSYPGETAWIAYDPTYPADAPHWIASGDLEPA